MHAMSLIMVALEILQVALLKFILIAMVDHLLIEYTLISIVRVNRQHSYFIMLRYMLKNSIVGFGF